MALTAFLPGHNLGVAIIILTFGVRLILVPLQKKALGTQRKLKELEPRIAKIKEEAKGDKQQESLKIMQLYKEQHINPFAGIGLMIPQIIVLIALFWVFREGATIQTKELYSFIIPPTTIGTMLLGIDLAVRSYLFAVLIAVTQYFHMRLTLTPPAAIIKEGPSSFSTDLNRSMYYQMKYIMPAFIAFISLSFPAAVALYWLSGNVFAIAYEGFINKAH
ncbi:MAG: YidC/Oxa1 family membrane protein insertase [Candidatus Roizmanbacteria bacterium]|nr:YidC/Oxa1 family membrane protein insertase [Candidatus Roizmanbacteria bacterium]